MLTTTYVKNGLVKNQIYVPRTWTDPLVRSKQLKRDMGFGTSSVRSLYRSDSLATAARELARYTLDLVGVQEVRLHKGGTERAGD